MVYVSNAFDYFGQLILDRCEELEKVFIESGHHSDTSMDCPE